MTGPIFEFVNSSALRIIRSQQFVSRSSFQADSPFVDEVGATLRTYVSSHSRIGQRIDDFANAGSKRKQPFRTLP